MELRVLQYFLAVAREQSIVLAAKSLHLSQPTLSTQIKKLEEELGKQLFIRGGKGPRRITLTEEGMILRKRAEEILELVHKTETEIASSDDMLMGDIYIGAGETDSIRLVARAAKQMQLRYPGIQFHISSGNAVYVKESLDRGLIDFGIIFGTVDMTSYHTLKLPATDTWGVLMRKDDPLAAKNVDPPGRSMGSAADCVPAGVGRRPGAAVAEKRSCKASHYSVLQFDLQCFPARGRGVRIRTCF